jgi:recombination protein U
VRDRGKQFEERFRADWLKTFPQSVIIRLPDQMSGYKTTSRNICDFICFNDGILYLIECKSHKGASIPFECIRQYNLMKSFVGIKGVRVGVVLWLYEKDVEYYIPTSTIETLKKENKKSVGLKAVEEGYNIKVIPTTKKRVFLEADYSVLSELSEGE